MPRARLLTAALSFAALLAGAAPARAALLVGSSATNQVLSYDETTGAFLGVFVAAGSGGLAGPQGLAFGPGGDLFVASGGTNQVLRYDGATGAFEGVFASGGGGASGLLVTCASPRTGNDATSRISG